MFAEQPELKPCPFCGSAAEYGECETDYPTEHKDCLVRCSNPSCRVRIERNTRVEDHDTKWIVVGLWNRRAKI